MEKRGERRILSPPMDPVASLLIILQPGLLGGRVPASFKTFHSLPILANKGLKH